LAIRLEGWSENQSALEKHKRANGQPQQRLGTRKYQPSVLIKVTYIATSGNRGLRERSIDSKATD
jgi:hypothetical protein